MLERPSVIDSVWNGTMKSAHPGLTSLWVQRKEIMAVWQPCVSSSSLQKVNAMLGFRKQCRTEQSTGTAMILEAAQLRLLQL